MSVLSDATIQSVLQPNARINCIRSEHNKAGKETGGAICDLCKKSVPAELIQEHVISKNHARNFFDLKIDSIVDSLELCAAQEEAISHILTEYSQNLLSQQDILQREQTVGRLEKLFIEWTSVNCKLRIFGSTLSRFATRDSDLNIELVLEESENEDSFQLLDKIYQNMLTDPSQFPYTNGEFDISTPRLTFEYGPVNYSIVLCAASHSAYEMSELLSLYTHFDPRVAQLGVCFRYWAKCCGLDRNDFGFWPPHVFPILVIHFLQNCFSPVLPSIHPSSYAKHIITLEEILPIYETQLSSWKVQNTQSLGALWVELFKYYSVELDIDLHTVSLREPGKPIKIESKKWTTTILAVEDPLHLDHNLARSIGERRLYAHFHRMLNKSYHYYMTPRSEKEIYIVPELFDMVICNKDPDAISSDTSLDNSDLSDANSDKEDDDSAIQNFKKKRGIKFDLASHLFRKLRKCYGIKFEYKKAVKPWESYPSSKFGYSLDVTKYDFYKEPPKYCPICRKCGHCKIECQSTKLPELTPLHSEMPPSIREELDKVCEQIYQRIRIDAITENEHCRILNLLTAFIQPKFPEAHLELFGSSRNGFGAKNCDLDICLTFTNDPTGKSIDQAKTIKTLAKMLRKFHFYFSHIFPITQAKVPIVKFKIRTKESLRACFDCDISLYNLLASRNTLMLRHYCAIDERVPKLGIIVKKFFKVCQICDASKGSLSSYAYTLMTLYYLQRCQPPVIPVLQELYEGEKPIIKCEGFNTWFFDDLDRLDQVWPHVGKNDSTIGELFFGFLRYFSEEYQYNRLVICIRQLKDLTKLEKKWTGKQIAIEDPFLLTHNLGQSLGIDMARFIKASIIMGRNHIGKPELPLSFRSPYGEEYFFDPKALIAGKIPRRGCHVCGCIGHIAAQCPKKYPQLLNQLSDSDSSVNDVREKNVPRGNLPRTNRIPRNNQQLPRGRTNVNYRGGRDWSNAAHRMHQDRQGSKQVHKVDTPQLHMSPEDEIFDHTGMHHRPRYGQQQYNHDHDNTISPNDRRFGNHHRQSKVASTSKRPFWGK